jgi:hypothetical protein
MRVSFVFIFFFFTICIYSQIKDKEIGAVFKINMKDGSQIYAKYLRSSEDTIFFKNERIGLLAIAKNDIDNYRNSNYLKKVFNPNNEYVYYNDYFATDNAFAPKEGSLFFQSVDLFYNKFAYGLTDHISIEGGSVFAEDVAVYYFGAKVGYSFNKFIHVGAKLNYFNDIANEDIFIKSGMLTFGSLKNNITFGTHFYKYVEYYGTNEIEHNKFYSISGSVSISKKSLFKVENILIGNQASIMNLGLSYNAKALSFGYGAIFPFSGDGFYEFIVLPYLSLKIPIYVR